MLFVTITAMIEVPEQIKPPAGEELVLKAHATGFQIYVCNDGAWTLKAPDAQLYDEQGKLLGHHYAGPTWKHADGSEITAKAIARAESPDSESIPWLLLTVTAHAGQGVLSRVRSIQRVNTRGGLPPLEPGSREAKSSYTADYYFYGDGPSNLT